MRNGAKERTSEKLSYSIGICNFDINLQRVAFGGIY
jgi:hypothetical protein